MLEALADVGEISQESASATTDSIQQQKGTPRNFLPFHTHESDWQLLRRAVFSSYSVFVTPCFGHAVF